MNIKEYIKQWAESYKTDLTENIMPFWMEHGWDKVNGGVYTCLDRDGSLIDSTKSVWFQGRFAFICAYAYKEEPDVAGGCEEHHRLHREALFRREWKNVLLSHSRGQAITHAPLRVL